MTPNPVELVQNVILLPPQSKTCMVSHLLISGFIAYGHRAVLLVDCIMVLEDDPSAFSLVSDCQYLSL